MAKDSGPDGAKWTDTTKGSSNGWPGPDEPAPPAIAALAPFQAAKAALTAVKRQDGKEVAKAVIDHCVAVFAYQSDYFNNPFPEDLMAEYPYPTETPAVTRFRSALDALCRTPGNSHGLRLLEYVWVECDC